MRAVLTIVIWLCWVGAGVCGETRTSWAHTPGMPDFSALYGWPELVAVNNNGLVRGRGQGVVLVAGRGDVNVAPPQAWCNGVVAALRAISPKPDLVVYDWENLPQNTIPEEETIVQEYLAALTCLRAAGTPGEFKWGYFAFIPHAAWPFVVDLWSTDANWVNWEAHNTILEPLAASVDFLSTPFYHYDGYTLAQMERIHRAHVMKARDLARKVGKPDMKLYCWTYNRNTAEVLLPVRHYLEQVRWAHQLCDGEWMFDWTTRDWATESALGWWKEREARGAARRSH